MEPYCADLNVRARVMASRLADRERLEQLAALDDLVELRRELQRRETAASGEVPPDPDHLETALRRSAGRALSLLVRWAGPRISRFSPLFEQEELRSLRILLRGAAQGAPRELRLSGLVPTRRLPEGALGALAETSSVPEVVELLTTWRHPWSARLEAAASGENGGLFALELALERAFLGEARRATRHAGSTLRAWLGEEIDAANTLTAQLLAGRDREALPDPFLEGGTGLSRTGFERAADSEGAEQARLVLSSELAEGPLAAALESSASETAHPFELRLLAARLEHWRRRALLDPVGVATLVAFALRLRTHVIDVGRVIWAVALEAPVEQRRRGWVTP